MPKSKENRKYARLELTSNVSFKVIETPDPDLLGERFRAIGKNIGVEGMLIESDKELSAGTVLDMEVILPKRKDPVFLQGEIRWCVKITPPSSDGPPIPASYSAGVKFFEVNKNHVLLLIKYVCGHLDESQDLAL
jgi:hypothetical protein